MRYTVEVFRDSDTSRFGQGVVSVPFQWLARFIARFLFSYGGRAWGGSRVWDSIDQEYWYV